MIAEPTDTERLEWALLDNLALSSRLDTIKLHAASYTHNGVQYAITLEGCHEEVHAHAMRLGLQIDGVVVEQSEIGLFVLRSED